MTDNVTPLFGTLTNDESRLLLARHNVGRIAFAFHDRVDIEPIGYVYEDGWIYGRTSEGAKLATIEHHRWVAFEVDEVKGPFDWRSVVVKGAFYQLDAKAAPFRDPAYEHALDLLRNLIPDTLRANDPTPFRSRLFRIHLDEVAGRSATTRAET